MHRLSSGDGADQGVEQLDNVYRCALHRYIILYVGASQSLVLSTGINLISDVVGAKAKTGAFVFGIYSLLDKFSSGIAIFLIGNSLAYSK
jgi:hypothetical protein